MSTVLTLCAANYLAHAKVLGRSLTGHNPDVRFVIGLVDKIPTGLDEIFWAPFELIPVERLKIPGFSEARFSIKSSIKQGLRSFVGVLPKRSQSFIKNLALFTARDCLRDTK